jgi:hypothetical protein
MGEMLAATSPSRKPIPKAVSAHAAASASAQATTRAVASIAARNAGADRRDIGGEVACRGRRMPNTGTTDSLEE